MATKNVIGEWEGGSVVQAASGKTVYYIRRRISGTLYEVSTRATKLKAALEHLKRFEANPAAYTPEGDAGPTGLVLDEELIEKHIADSKMAGTSAEWRAKKKKYLTWWSAKFDGRDLRTLTLRDLQLSLDGVKARHHRAAVAKALFAWLRQTGRITRKDDPTLDLKIEQPKPAAWQGRNRAISRADFDATFAKIRSDTYRDVLRALEGTGAHVNEVYRLASGEGEIGSDTLGLSHKLGHLHRMKVSPETVAAAKRLLAGGGFSVSRFAKAVRRAAKEAGVAPWSPGGMRHSVASWLFASGSRLEEISAWLGHLSPATTRKFYAAFSAAPMPNSAAVLGGVAAGPHLHVVK